MRDGLEFLLRLLDFRDPAYVSQEDFTGPRGEAARTFQRTGFISAEPCMNPVPSCPHCLSGAPYRIGAAYVCPLCHSAVDRADLWLWRLDLEAFLRWVASSLGLEGPQERVDAGLWRLGALAERGLDTECFYLRGAAPSDRALRRLSAFRSALVLHGKTEAPDLPEGRARTLALLDLLSLDEGGPQCVPLNLFFRRGGRVWFDQGSGALFAGDLPLGTIDSETREYHLIACLAGRQGESVAYADLKRHVCARTGSRDETDEATFCQKLKARIKGRYRVAHVDRLIQPDARAGGYRLVRELDLAGG